MDGRSARKHDVSSSGTGKPTCAAKLYLLEENVDLDSHPLMYLASQLYGKTRKDTVVVQTLLYSLNTQLTICV